MSKRNDKIISWNNIFEHTSISFKIIEIFFFHDRIRLQQCESNFDKHVIVSSQFEL